MTLLLLATGACGAPTAPETYDAAWAELDRVYALFEVKGVDWDAGGDAHRPRADASDEELRQALMAMLAPLDDNHVQLLVPGHAPWTPGSLQDLPLDSYHADVVDGLLDEAAQPHRFVRTGQVDGFGYLWVGRIDKQAVDAAVDWIATAPETGLILDVRQNGGGYALHAEALAAPFVGSSRVYSRNRRLVGPDEFGDWLEFTVSPAEQGYGGPVVVLTDPYTVSGAELLLMALDGEPGLDRIGMTTAGAFGARVWRDLPNGWVVSATVEDTRTADGESLEGIGLAPDVEVVTDLEDLAAGVDPILAAAVDRLRGGGR